jgi:two-component sensor histidine kinase
MENKPIRVLLVDDDDEDFLVTRELLSRVAGRSFQVEWAANYEAGLEAITRNQHDVYLLDYRLGAKTGLDLLRDAIAAGSRAPMILLTGQGDREVDLEAMQAGAADYVVKAWNNAAVLERSIRYAIAQKQAEDALRQMSDELERRVQERTAQLAKTNQELQAEVRERLRVEERLRASLREKEVLLREIHHRVKNNLQVICSLLKLQSEHIQDPRALEVFRESQERVKSMALIHEKLYRFRDLARIDFGDYVRSLAGKLFHAYAVDPDGIHLTVNVDDVLLPIDAVMPCALLIHELVANALKHAFPDGNGEIFIDFHTADQQTFTLSVRDTGVGWAGDFRLDNEASLGGQLVAALVDQLDGTLELDHANGFTCKITFALAAYRERGISHDQCTSACSGR